MKKLIVIILLLGGCAQAAPIAPPEVPYKPNPAPVVPDNPRRGNYTEITSDAQYDVFKQKHENSPTCQYFSASWCGPCKQFAPIFKRVADRNKHVLFVKIDIDGCPNAATMNGVKSIPTVIFKKERFTGAKSEVEFESIILRLFPRRSL